MMGNIMEYKGYHTKIEFDAESKTLRGKIEGINDYIDFEASDILNIELEFHAAVDDYLEFCKEVGKDPERELRGFKDVCSVYAAVESAFIAFVDNDQTQTRALPESVDGLTETIDNACLLGQI